MSKKTKTTRLEEELKIALVEKQKILNTLTERENELIRIKTELITVNQKLDSKKEVIDFQTHLLTAKQKQHNELEKEFIKLQFILNGVIKSFESLQEYWTRTEPNVTYMPLGATSWIKAEKKVETE